MLRALGYPVVSCCDVLRHFESCWLNETGQIFHATYLGVAWCCSRLARFHSRLLEAALLLVSKAIQNRNVRLGQRSRFLVLTKRIAASREENGKVRATMLHSGMRASLIFNTQHVATRRKCAQHVSPNSVVIYCAEMLRSFGRSLQMLGQQCCNVLCWYSAIFWPGL